MKIQHHDDTLSVRDIKELGAPNADAFRNAVRAAMPQNQLKVIEIDLSQTSSVDSCGLGALIGIYKTACNHNGGVAMRLINPTPPVQQLFELTRMHRLFEIVNQ